MGTENNFANENYIECGRARDIKNTIEGLKKEFLRASEADGKLYFYCRGAALFDDTNLIQPYDNFDYRTCASRKCKDKECFKRLHAEWDEFVDSVGGNEFNHTSNISEVAASLLNADKLKKRTSALESAINEALITLTGKGTIERDIIIIAKILLLIKQNPDLEKEAYVSRFKNNIKEKFGIEDKEYDVANVYLKVKEYYER